MYYMNIMIRNYFKKFEYPILKHFLDTDAYKLYMQQAVFYSYYNINVVSELICRDNDYLGYYSDLIMYQIKMMDNLKLSDIEFKYISSLPFFKKDYINWLKKFRYDTNQIKLNNYYGKLKISISGPWREVILWEVPILALISEIVHKNRNSKINSKHAINYLYKKINHFKKKTNDLDLSKLKIIDFGTRRRFSYTVHFNIIKTLIKEFPWFIGSSNYHIARLLKIEPVGTQSHEWFQAHQQISKKLKYSQRLALKIWLDQYDNHLNIALTDCITSDAFLNDFNFEFADRYKGVRHDSGNPFIWGEKILNHYNKLGINPIKKTLLFSDNLNFNKIIYLYRHFSNKINLIFGLGTKLTCDIPHIKPLNIVIKLIKCNNKPVAKLSDSPGKTVCYDKNFILSLKKAFNVCNIKNNF